MRVGRHLFVTLGGWCHCLLLAGRDRGYAFRKLGDWSNAIGDYRTSLTLAPGNVKTYNNLGYSYAKGGDYENAIRSYSTVRGAQPLWCCPTTKL